MEFIFTFFCFYSKSKSFIFYLLLFIFCIFLFLPCVLSYCFLRPAIHRLATIVSEALFYTGCDTPFQGPSLGRPILGASNHGYLLYLLITWIFGCWCEENTGRHFKGFYFVKEFSMQNNKYMGEIECKATTNTTYIYITEW